MGVTWNEVYTVSLILKRNPVCCFQFHHFYKISKFRGKKIVFDYLHSATTNIQWENEKACTEPVSKLWSFLNLNNMENQIKKLSCLKELYCKRNFMWLSIPALNIWVLKTPLEKKYSGFSRNKCDISCVKFTQ